VLVAEHTAGPKSNKFVEKVGTYNPKTKDTQLNADRIKYWLSVGAQATDRVHNMLVKAGIIKADTINVLPQKTPVIKEEEIKEESVDDAKEDDTTKEKADEEVSEESKDDNNDESKEDAPATSDDTSDQKEEK
jgi:small subunit ribosomal protein S16